MYVTISDLFRDVTGVDVALPVPTFATFFILSIVSAYALLRHELKRKGIKNLFFSSYQANRKYPRSNIFALKIVLVGGITGIAGARLLAILQNPATFLEAPVYVLFFPELAFNGGLLFGILVMFLYSKAGRFRLPSLLDAAAPALMAAYGIGRMGCYFSGRWTSGIQNHLPKPELLSWLPDFLWYYNLPVQQVGNDSGAFLTGSEPIFPTQLYESVFCMVCFILLWSARRSCRTPGALFGLFLLLYGFERFFIENIREQGHQAMAWFIQPQPVSVILCLMGGVLLYWSYRRHKTGPTHYHNYLNKKTGST